jgi:hypothetical protein
MNQGINLPTRQKEKKKSRSTYKEDRVLHALSSCPAQQLHKQQQPDHPHQA